MSYVMVTNNCRCYEKWRDRFQMEFEADWTYLDVLTKARDYIHKGYHLLTHPLAGSLKPNQTPLNSSASSSVSRDRMMDLKGV